MRSSKKARLTNFRMPLTALMIVSGLTSIFYGNRHPPPSPIHLTTCSDTIVDFLSYYLRGQRGGQAIAGRCRPTPISKAN